MPTAVKRGARAPSKRVRGQRREEILDAALGLIAREGFAAATHRRVADAAGVPLGSTTYYFASREELLREAFRRYLALVSAELEQAAERLLAAPSLPGLLDYLVDFTEREVQDQAVMVLEYELLLFAVRDGALGEEFHAWQEGLVAELAKILRALGGERPTEAARTVIQLVRGYEFEQVTRRSPRSQALRRRLGVVLRGYLEA